MMTLAFAKTSQAKEEDCYWVKPPPQFKPYQIEVYRREWGGFANPHRFYYVRKVNVKDRAIGPMGRHLYNKYRAEVGVPPLQWSDYLANQAQAYANYLAVNLLFGRHSNVKDQGENLWWGTSQAYSFTAMIDWFGSEKRHFINGVFPNVSNTGNWRHVGHYTQVVWRKTRYVGCAGTDGRDRYYRLVCRYYPAGNIRNERVF